MKKRNKILAMLLAMTMCGTALAGCGSENASSEVAGSEATSTETTETTATETVAEQEPLKNVDIYPLTSDKTFTVFTPVDLYGGGEKKVNDYVDAIEKGTGISIDWKTVDKEQAKLIITSKEFPDAFFFYGGLLDKSTIYEYGQAGYFVNFMDYLDIMPNFSAFLEEYPEVYELAKNDDGSIYSLPSINVDSTSTNNMVYYRTDMMKEIGWENPPATTDEFLQFIVELQEHFGAKDPEFVAFNAYTKSQMLWSANWLPRYFFCAFGELSTQDLTIDSKGNAVLGGATEQYRHYLEFMNKIWESGAFNTNVYTQEAAASNAMAAGNHVAVFGKSTGLSIDNFESGNFDLAVLEPLTSEYWDTKHWYLGNKYQSSKNTMLSTTCEDIETMVKWLDAFYSTPENPLNEEGTIWGNVLGSGELGVSYELDDTTMTVTYNNNENSGPAFGGVLYNGYENGMNPYTMVPDTALGVKSYGTVNNLWPYAETPIMLKDLVLTTEENDAYTDAWADITAYLAESCAKFITGELDIEVDENWNNYLSELNKMGLEDVLKIMQAAYDRSTYSK